MWFDTMLRAWEHFHGCVIKWVQCEFFIHVFVHLIHVRTNLVFRRSCFCLGVNIQCLDHPSTSISEVVWCFACMAECMLLITHWHSVLGAYWRSIILFCVFLWAFVNGLLKPLSFLFFFGGEGGQLFLFYVVCSGCVLVVLKKKIAHLFFF